MFLFLLDPAPLAVWCLAPGDAVSCRKTRASVVAPPGQAGPVDGKGFLDLPGERRHPFLPQHRPDDLQPHG